MDIIVAGNRIWISLTIILVFIVFQIVCKGWKGMYISDSQMKKHKNE